MSHRLRALGLAAVCVVAVGVVALLTGCAQQTAPTPTPTPHFTSEAAAYKAAEETYRAYVDALNRVDLSDPATFEDVYKWETGDALKADKKNLTRYHAEGVTKTGQSVIVFTSLRQPPHGSSIVTIDVCEDVSSIELRRPDGTSLVAATRPPVQATAVTFDLSSRTPLGLAVSAVLGRKDGPAC